MSLASERQLCLDLMKVSWAGTHGSTHSDCAILLEIAPDGGLLQTTVAVPCGSEITLTVGEDLSRDNESPVSGGLRLAFEERLGRRLKACNPKVSVPASRHPRYLTTRVLSSWRRRARDRRISTRARPSSREAFRS